MADIAPTLAEPRRNANRTREAILRAAQTLFTEKGYTTTGVREIAAQAGVNSTLIRRYFGSKQGLLKASLEDLLSIQPMIAGERASFGVRAAAMLLNADSIANPVAIMLLSMADPEARELCGNLVQDNVIVPLAKWLGGANAMDRAAQLNALWTGFITAQQLIPLRQLAGKRVRPTQHWVARISQAIADGV